MPRILDMITDQTYDSLTDQYQAAVRLRRQIEARMLKCRPGSVEGHDWYSNLKVAERRETELRKLVRNHPDAPPAG